MTVNTKYATLEPIFQNTIFYLNLSTGKKVQNSNFKIENKFYSLSNSFLAVLAAWL